ncbi:PIN domain-containing protein [Phormidesmis priestleyi]
MSVIVNTSVWSLALRRNTPDTSIVNQLRALIAEDEVVIFGAIRQEILSGIRTAEQFVRLRDYLRAFSELPLTHDDYEIAAEFFNRRVAL